MTEAKVGCHLWHSEADEGDVREQLVELAEGGNAEPGGVRRSQGREGVQFLICRRHFTCIASDFMVKHSRQNT